jgi:predicted 3-demethylubiquinone-9 3-methyltransferase (glyoxalase superfamily)
MNRSKFTPLLVLSLALGMAGCQSADSTDGVDEKPMTQLVSTQLMFIGNAEEAMNLYVSTLPDSRVVSIERYGPNETGTEGSIKLAVFSLMGNEVRCIDSNIKHDFTFTPSMSLFVTCRSEAEIDALAAKLSEGGEVLMPLDSYGFSKRFTFVADRFGVSWQLNLPND